ncbi:DHHA1 domain-containing protein, partial [Bdellovibrionota bacterium]
TGRIRCGEETEVEVTNTLKPHPNIMVHHGRIKSGSLKVGETCSLQVNAHRRTDIRLNHTATHLLHWALRKVLGKHVKQAGSLVAPDRLRFDYTHFESVSPEQLQEVEQLINKRIREDSPVAPKKMEYKEALKSGAMALFGEKYQDRVRVISVGEFSKELCGGTHVSRTGEIRLFVIVSDSSIASGIRRIEALTGDNAFQFLTESHQRLIKIGGLIKAHSGEIVPKLERIIAKEKELEREISRLKKQAAHETGKTVRPEDAETINDIKVIAAETPYDNPQDLRELADQLKLKLKSGVVCLSCVAGEKAFLVVSITKDLTKKFHAGKIVKEIAKEVGGSGGGRPDFAQAGGTDPKGIEKALKQFKTLIKNTGA